jgi:hypothetical protein
MWIRYLPSCRRFSPHRNHFHLPPPCYSGRPSLPCSARLVLPSSTPSSSASLPLGCVASRPRSTGNGNFVCTVVNDDAVRCTTSSLLGCRHHRTVGPHAHGQGTRSFVGGVSKDHLCQGEAWVTARYARRRGYQVRSVRDGSMAEVAVRLRSAPLDGVDLRLHLFRSGWPQVPHDALDVRVPT